MKKILLIALSLFFTYFVQAQSSLLTVSDYSANEHLLTISSATLNSYSNKEQCRNYFTAKGFTYCEFVETATGTELRIAVNKEKNLAYVRSLLNVMNIWQLLPSSKDDDLNALNKEYFRY